MYRTNRVDSDIETLDKNPKGYHRWCRAQGTGTDSNILDEGLSCPPTSPLARVYRRLSALSKLCYAFEALLLSSSHRDPSLLGEEEFVWDHIEDVVQGELDDLTNCT